ncbi:MAG: ArsR/SmtB family transcription factor [Microbacteriaceae bacterium]
MNIFEILAHPIRHRIITVLASGEHTSGNLVDVITHEFAVSKSTVSWHLALLREHDCVIVRSDWNERWYRLDEQCIRRLAGELSDLKKRWKMRIGSIERTDPLASYIQSKKRAARKSYTQGWSRRGKQE